MLSIVKAPHAILSTPAKKVSKIDKSVRDLIKDMREALDAAKDPEGVGLAAPQVGRELQIFIVRQSPKATPLTFINPKVMIPDNGQVANQQKHSQLSKKNSVKLEGCLSLQNIWGTVWRHQKIHVIYQDEAGVKHKRTFVGFLATIIQHEYDHLNGILFPSRVLEQQGKLYKSHKNEKGEEVFDEISL